MSSKKTANHHRILAAVKAMGYRIPFRGNAASACSLLHLVIFLALPFSVSAQIAADTNGVMKYIYNGPESPLDVRYLYHWEILKTALERTQEKYGPFLMQPSPFMTESRQTEELKNPDGKLTVMYLVTTPERERSLIPIRIPVDKSLGSYNVFLIRKENQSKYNSIKTVDELRKFTFGLGLGWEDVVILKTNHFKVVTGSSYDGLFEMLVNKRFDVFLRASVEVLDEYERRKDKMPDMHIEDNILFYYPWPMYFWFSKTEGGRRLADRARKGMMEMIEDGAYDAIFAKYQNHKIERLRLKDRRLFKIDNPLLVPETPLNDARLWFDPASLDSFGGKSK